MHVEVKLFDDLDAVARDADIALDRAQQPGLFDRIAWYRLLQAHLPATPLVARARIGEAVAWLFLADRGGGRAEALACWYTLAFTPAHHGIADDGTRLRLLAAIAKALKPRLSRIMLAPVPDPARQDLERAFAATGWGTIVTQASVNRYVALDPDTGFDAWWLTRPGRLRNTVRRKAKAGAFHIAIADRFDPALWADYEAVYADSWKGAEGSPALLRALAEAEGDAGTLRIGIARLGDAPVAAQFWLVDGGVATIHKLAYVETARPLSPGTVLTAAMFRHVIDRDRPHLIDFGTGDDPYKAEWMDDARPLWRIDLFRLSSPLALLRYARARAAALVRARRGG